MSSVGDWSTNPVFELEGSRPQVLWWFHVVRFLSHLQLLTVLETSCSDDCAFFRGCGNCGNILRRMFSAREFIPDLLVHLVQLQKDTVYITGHISDISQHSSMTYLRVVFLEPRRIRFRGPLWIFHCIKEIIVKTFHWHLNQHERFQVFTEISYGIPKNTQLRPLFGIKTPTRALSSQVWLWPLGSAVSCVCLLVFLFHQLIVEQVTVWMVLNSCSGTLFGCSRTVPLPAEYQPSSC